MMSMVPPDQQGALDAARQGLMPTSYTFFRPDYRHIDYPIMQLSEVCPACNNSDASVWGRIEWGAEELQAISPIPLSLEGREEANLLFPEVFFCASCELRFDSFDELEAAGFSVIRIATTRWGEATYWDADGPIPIT
ncbi:hypothetical protein [Nonomuraea longicatena]|uniref:Uncharacterized protein n=1 Tax=Nonomuraea longicatena TaxID=83682 RepID=A0ABP3ZAI1_9ACTN